MPVAFTASNSSVSASALDLITSALKETSSLAAEETPSAADSAWGLEKLQRLIDRFNAREALIHNVNFATYTLQANHSPHTIGPSGDFNVALRPVRLANANLVLTSSSPSIDLPLAVRDDDWWAANQIKGLTSTLPTDVYYSPGSPLGSLYFWPVPSAVNDVRLETWVNLTQAVDLSTMLALPAAYWDLLVLTLGRDLAPSLGPTAVSVVGSGLYQAMLREAMKVVEGNNSQSPRIATRQAGMPGGNSRRPGFNFLTGKPW